MKALKAILKALAAITFLCSLGFAGAAEPDGGMNLGWSLGWLSLALIVAYLAGWCNEPVKK